MNLYNSASGLLLILETGLIGCKAISRGSNDISFTTQALRLLMFCARYFDWYLTTYFHFMRVFLLLSTLTVVVILWSDKCSQGAHKNISAGAVIEVVAMILFSSALGAHFMYAPTVLEFAWSFSRFLDVVLEIPQLKMVFVAEKVDEWITGYYFTIGIRVILCIVNWVYRDKVGYVLDVITIGTTISKGFIIATLFVARFFNQRRHRLAGGYEGIPP